MNCKHILLPLSLVFLALSCEKSPTGPEPVKDPRTYTWTIDTLAYPGSFQTTMRDIWGSSPNDVYVVGHNDQPGPGTMFHYDGKTWRTTGFHSAEGGSVQGPVSLSAIYGFAPNDVWAVGEHISSNPTPPPNFLDSSLIIHYDGTQWREVKLNGGRGLAEVSVPAPNDIWVCGTAGTLFHFDGSKWERDSVLVSLTPGSEFWLTRITADRHSVFMLGLKYENQLGRETFYFFSKTGQFWAVADSFVIAPGQWEFKWGAGALWISPWGTLFSAGTGGVFRWTGSNWVNVFQHPTSLRSITGTSEQNMFVAGDYGKLYHYNGTDWFQYKELETADVVYSGVWTDGKEIFVVGYTNDGGKTIILHAK